MRDWCLLALLLAAVLASRLAVIRWGLPPAIPEVRASGIRSSYAFDEANILTPISLTRPGRLDFDPREYQWGALHLELVLLSLEIAEHAGYVPQWRRAYYNLVPGDFERVYVAGRMVSVLGALASIALIFFLALEYAGRQAAFWAAALVAASPAHLLASAQIRVDLSMTALLILAAWLAVRTQKQCTPRRFLWLGVAAGASVAAKYTAIFLVIPVLLVTLWTRRFARRQIAAVLLGAISGFLLGEPYFLARPHEITQQVMDVVRRSHSIPAPFRIPVPDLLATQFINGARFLIGAPAAALAIAGIIIMVRRGTAADWMPILVLLGGIASFVPLLWPMLRYQVPLLPWLALAAALALEACPRRWRMLLGAAAIAMPLAASIDQFRFMRSPHPANLMLRAILERVPPGTPVARVVPQIPPLDRSIYPMDRNPLLDNLSLKPPAWLLLSDLPLIEYPATTTSLLQSQYAPVAAFHDEPRFPWATLGRSRRPHDWKYTHPGLVLYRRQSP